MIYNTRNRSNDTTETQKKRSVLMLMQEESETIGKYSKQTNKMWSLKCGH